MSAERELVLSQQSVSRIRFYVKHKFAHLPHERHAEIVADAIIKIIEKQLPPFSEQSKKKITNQLIEEIVIPQKRPVSLYDIQQICKVNISDTEELEIYKQWQVERFTAPNQLTANPSPEHHNITRRNIISLLYAIGCIFIVGAALFFSRTTEAEPPLTTEIQPLIIKEEATVNLPDNELPVYYQYSEIKADEIKAYLNTRNSILAEEPFFTTIYETAKQYNIHPLLMFAITGQEQGFVPRDHPNVDKIANNPFNVYHSWEDYNTSIEDSSAIAARTIVNLSKDRPEDIDAIVWINRKYAEDPNWSKGVQSLFETLNKHNSK